MPNDPGDRQGDRGKTGAYAPEEPDEETFEPKGRWPGRRSLTEYLPQRRGFEAALSSAGQPLPSELGQRLGKALNTDLDDVRVHTGSDAAGAARDLDARAFTYGQNVYFGAGEYRPGTDEGDHVIAHEVAHAVQQRGAGRGGPVEVSEPEDSHEVEAHGFAHSFMMGGTMGPARVSPVSQGSVARMKVHRLLAGTVSNQFTPQAIRSAPDEFQVAGVQATLTFDPGGSVDASKIGFIQMVSEQKAGKPHTPETGTPQERSTREGRGVPNSGDKTFHGVDQRADSPHPNYGQKKDGSMDAVGSKSMDNKLGFRFMDAGGTIQTGPAQMTDYPHLVEVGANSCQKFETAIVALDGKQAGTYYGTVSWGWEIDGSCNYNAIRPTEKDGDPSPLFQRAAQMWNQGMTVDGMANLPIPIPYEDAARKLDTPALVSKFNSESDPNIKAIFGHVLKSRQMQIDVSGSGADLTDSVAEVYIKLSGGVANYRSPILNCPDGGSVTFHVLLDQIVPATGSLSSIRVTAMDQDVSFDEELGALDWSSPFAPASGGGKKYTINAKLL